LVNKTCPALFKIINIAFGNTACVLDIDIYAEVVTRVASSLEAGGLPGYPESKINVLKT
jgi:hypothetical protein